MEATFCYTHGRKKKSTHPQLKGEKKKHMASAQDQNTYKFAEGKLIGKLENDKDSSNNNGDNLT